MITTNIKVNQYHSNPIWFVTATVNNLDYQQRFSYEPSDDEVNSAVMSFEHNYAGLNESTNKPVIVKPHHNEE